MVDGVSKYPEMLSNHSFDLLSCFPEAGAKSENYAEISYSEVCFLEPESRSDQNRLLSIVRTGETTGYYVDIFRSKKQRGGDKFHDYFYHNLGQDLQILDKNGNEMTLTPNDEMGFAGGHLFALDYMWDKKSARTDQDYQAIWKMSMPDGNHVYMNLWMKGYKGREIFAIKSPPTKAFRANHNLPYDVLNEPFLTISARQHGEAWNHPFVSIFEPTTENEGRSIIEINSFVADNDAEISPDFVGLEVKSKSGRTDYIFSSTKDEKVSYNGITTDGTYSVISENNGDFYFFLGNGKFLRAKTCTIQSAENNNVILKYTSGNYYISCEMPVSVRINKKRIKLNAVENLKLNL
jgi:hypothetical protein